MLKFHVKDLLNNRFKVISSLKILMSDSINSQFHFADFHMIKVRFEFHHRIQTNTRSLLPADKQDRPVLQKHRGRRPAATTMEVLIDQ